MSIIQSRAPNNADPGPRMRCNWLCFVGGRGQRVPTRRNRVWRPKGAGFHSWQVSPLFLEVHRQHDLVILLLYARDNHDLRSYCRMVLQGVS